MSNPYPQRFLELLAETAGPVLDNGGGGRSHPKVTSLEYVSHPNNTVQGDGLALPFRDDTFDLILSQAVLEHVLEPQRYVDEMVRVLRPGGLVYIEVAFMQPVHMAPMHYFNVTPHGLAHLCRGLETVEHGAFGRLVDQWEWIGREAGANEALTEQERALMRRMFAKVDAAISPTQLANVASGACLLGRKR
jgi:SAM-dependent methyltransferase